MKLKKWVGKRLLPLFDSYRVGRGSGWVGYLRHARVADRLWTVPSDHWSYLGVRLVRKGQ